MPPIGNYDGRSAVSMHFVWKSDDGLSSKLERHHVDAASPEEAAQDWAENDGDGNADGIYSGDGRVLNVIDQFGVVHRILVSVEMVPEFSATKIGTACSGTVPLDDTDEGGAP